MFKHSCKTESSTSQQFFQFPLLPLSQTLILHIPIIRCTLSSKWKWTLLKVKNWIFFSLCSLLTRRYMHKNWLLATEFVFNMQIYKNMTFDWATYKRDWFCQFSICPQESLLFVHLTLMRVHHNTHLLILPKADMTTLFFFGILLWE